MATGERRQKVPKLGPVDLRSDTVTKPTPEMRQGMAEAEVGDDVYGEDPTINELERTAAATLGKEAALFVPTTTMGNLISLMAHCDSRGCEAILGSKNHICLFEQGGLATVGGIMPLLVPSLDDGTVDLAEVERLVKPKNVHFTATRVLAIEQSHNLCGGAVLPLSFVDEAGALCKRHGLKLHMDGARLFNAVSALGTTPARMAEHVDSCTVCLSKGLCAPVGSLIVGEAGFVEKCRHLRKVLGGGLRQGGVLAACGLIGLRAMAGRLAEDHRRARELGAAISEMDGLTLVKSPETNMVFFTVGGSGAAAEFIKRAAERGVLVGLLPFAGTEVVRAATHNDVSDADLQRAAQVMREVAASLRAETTTTI